MDAGVASALGAAFLFGAGTPLAKLLLDDVGPRMLAGLFYWGSGLGLSIYRIVSRAAPVKLPRGEAKWLAGATLAGGVVGPVLLMTGLTSMPASGASLLLNAEGGRVKLGMDSTLTANLRLTLELLALYLALEITFELAGDETI